MQQKTLPFKLEFSETEKITPYAGLCLYGEMYRALGIDKEVEQFLPKPKSGAGYSANTYINPLTMMFMGGGRYIEDIKKIEADKGLREMCQMDIVPTSDAIGDWMRRESIDKEEGIRTVNDGLVRRMIRKVEAESVMLDIDAMGIEASKREAQYTYQGYRGYMPMLGFIPEIDCCVGYEFREGNESPGSRNYEFVVQMMEKVKRFGKWIGCLRSDSAAYQARIFNCVNNDGGKYGVTVDQDVAVQHAIKQIPEHEWKPMKDRDGILTDREYAEFIHTMNESDHAFRVVIQRWENPRQDLFETYEEYCYHGVATNWQREEKSSEEVIWWHNGRSNAENYNKEVKIGFNLEYVPCGEYGANAVWFGIGILTYNLFIASKIFLFPPSWAKKTIRTIRWQFIQMAGRIINHAGMLVLRVCGISREIYELYQTGRKQCMLLNCSG